LKSFCPGTFGSIWNFLIQIGLILSIFNTKILNKKFFEENTFESLITYVKGSTEKFSEKKKVE